MAREGQGVSLAFVLALALTLTTFGLAAGASTQILAGSAEAGQGAVVSEQGLTYWGWHATDLGTLPTPVPARASLAVAAPTPLPRFGRSYTINPSVAGQTGVEWVFQETVTAARSTELVLTFFDGLNPPGTTITVYVETNARAPPGTVTFNFWWDAGAFSPSALTIESLTATVEVCTAIGTCP